MTPKTVPIKAVLEAIADEPELPGEPPYYILEIVSKAMVSGNAAPITNLLRSTVKATKASIAERVKKL